MEISEVWIHFFIRHIFICFLHTALSYVFAMYDFFCCSGYMLVNIVLWGRGGIVINILPEIDVDGLSYYLHSVWHD